MPVVSIRVPTVIHEKLMEYCERKDTKPSAVILDFLVRMADHLDDLAYAPQGAAPQADLSTARQAPSPIKRIPGPQIGFAMDGTPLYGNTGPRLKQPKRAKE